MATIGTLAVNLTARTRVFDRKVKKSGKNLHNMTRRIGGAQRRLMGFLKGALAVGGLTYAIKGAVLAFAAFEKQMAMVSTMLNAQTMSYMPRYTKQIRKMAIEFGESTETLTKGLYDILSASVAPAKALKVLAVSAKAAKAGITSTAVAADAITTILNSYGLSADRAGDVSDKLFMIIKRGKTTFAELAPNIGKVAALAATAGLSFDELGAAIATLTRAGLQSEIAITGIRAILTTFLKPQRDAVLAARKFGLELNTNTFRTIGLTGVLRKLSNASAEQLAKIMPNVRALAAFAAATQNATGQARDLRGMLDALGTSQEAFGKMTDTTAHKIDQLKAKIQDFKIFAGKYWAPKILGSTDVFGESVKKVQFFVEAWKRSFSGLRAGLGWKAPAEFYKELVEYEEKAKDVAAKTGGGGPILAPTRNIQAALKPTEIFIKSVKSLDTAYRNITGRIQTFGKTANQVMFANLVRTIEWGKMTEKEIAETGRKLRHIAGRLKELDKLEAMKNLKEGAEQLKDSLKGPIEVLKDFRAELDKMFEAGLLSKAQKLELLGRRAKELLKFDPSVRQDPGQGRQYRPMYQSVKSMRIGAESDPQTSELEKQTKQDKERNILLQQLVQKDEVIR